MNALQILKNSGEREDFSIMKLQNSLVACGLEPARAKEISAQIKQKCSQGYSTKKLYRLARKLIKKESRVLASRYSMTKAISELGPDGFHFEKFICAIFNQQGYRATTNISLKGKCVEHEIDVKAVGEKTILCECKFHNNPNSKNDVKTSLYVNARAEDLRNNSQNSFHEFWLVSNTKFSKDAITYSNCVGLKLLGPNAPKKQALSELAIKTKVFPVSVLTTLKKSQAKYLIQNDCLLVSQLVKNQQFFEGLELSQEQKGQILNEAENLLK
ncbi:MAG: hypothetical protein CME62_01305 [Halobacteriovoraceae bacterium]|nr:hypothetical protein [Halobacteriovoraceae bacterium]|tara:strand:- start:10163 stop:10975 length:813 start_codon:yes stop_codon:yes gene_type:complete